MSIRYRLQLIKFLDDYKFSHFNIYLNQKLSENYFSSNKNSALNTIKNFIRNYSFCNYILCLLLTKKNKLPKIIKTNLLLGIYQLYFQNEIPDYSIVNESTELTFLLNYKPLKSLVNGVLRNFIRKKELFNEQINEIKSKDKIKYFSIKYSFKEWILKRWAKNYDFTELEKILLFYNNDNYEQSVLYLKSNIEEFLNDITKKNIKYRKSQLYNDIIYFKNISKLIETYKLSKDDFIILDETSCIPSFFYNNITNKTSNLLEVGSFPGTKTVLINKKIDIFNYNLFLIDTSKHKLEKFYNNKKKYNIRYKDIYTEDFLSKKFDIKFDAVFIDAPCSALGTIKKNPEIKYNRTEKDIKNISVIQEKMIHKALDLLVIDGILVYSVCSFEPEETTELIKNVLSSRKDVLYDDRNQLTENLKSCLIEDNGFLSVPCKSGLSGFFVTKLKKIDYTLDKTRELF